MEPPLKRPRIHMFGPVPSTDMELDDARANNDLALKSRFEAIFEKYSHDFSNLGDEIDVLTGDVVVNRGHLENMISETDTGIASSRDYNATTYDGRSLLKAMMEMPDNDEVLVNPNADEVLQSIETIADNAMLTDEASGDESEDDLFGQPQPPDEEQDEALEISDTAQDYDTPMYRQGDSDTDSLFEKESYGRSDSPDSLFDQDTSCYAAPQQNFQMDMSQESSRSSTIPIAPMATEDEMLARYRPMIRQELMDILEEQKERAESLIEPAWRIPVHVNLPDIPTRGSQPARQSSSLSRVISIDRSPTVSDEQFLQRQATTQSVNTKQTSVKRSVQVIRDESEDPLQEGFSTEHEPSPRQNAESTPSSEWEPEETYPRQEAEDDELYAESTERKRLLETAATGICPYCKVGFTNKSGVMAHWDRWLVKPARHKSKNDQHDAETIREIRSVAVRRKRNPRLILADFRTMVELHEGAGLSFEEIANSQTLRTRKTAPQLRDIFDKHRSIPFPGHSPPPSCHWSKKEEQILVKLCRNDRATLATITNKLIGKDEIDVGNKLAEMFLKELGQPQGIPARETHISVAHLPTNFREYSQVKQEPLDDLFL